MAHPVLREYLVAFDAAVVVRSQGRSDVYLVSSCKTFGNLVHVFFVGLEVCVEAAFFQHSEVIITTV